MIRRRLRVVQVLAVAAAVGAPLAVAGSSTVLHRSAHARTSLHVAAVPPSDWLGFGRTPDQNRNTPLAQITPANVSGLKRDYLVNFRAIDSTIKNGEQSYPLEFGGVIYMTTNDDNVWAVQATTGKVVWRFQPPNVALFKNFGIVANRGLAYCDGKLFLTTLDMHIDALSRRRAPDQERADLRRRPGRRFEPGVLGDERRRCAPITSSSSAPPARNTACAASSWATTPISRRRGRIPYWTIPPEQTEWRKAGRLVGGGVDWNPADDRHERPTRSTSAPARRRRSTTRPPARQEPARRLPASRSI